MKTLNKRITCNDGFELSIQANSGAYCHPRVDDADAYMEVEIGYPSEKDDLIMAYAEQPSSPTETVYAYVPVDLVYLLLTKHGGIKDGEVPRGVLYYEDKFKRR